MVQSIGWLQPAILLDDAKKVHYGSHDPITGNVRIRYSAQENKSLFGPLKISMIFKGRSKVNITKRNGQHHHRSSSDVPLFWHEITIYDGAFNCQPGGSENFPFKICFPENIQGSYAGIASDPTFSQEVTALPPSFSGSGFEFGGRYESSIQYQLGVDIAMRGLKISIAKPEQVYGEREPTILYENPRLPQPFEDPQNFMRGTISVSNEFLLDEKDRPSGFRQRAKAAFNTDYYPKYTFEWTCDGPKELYLNQPATFRIHIKPQESLCTAAVAPAIYLNSCSIAIEGHTAVRADDGLFTKNRVEGRKTVAVLKCIMDKEPFSKAQDWTKSVTTQPIIGIPSAFSMINITRKYSIQLKLNFRVAEMSKSPDQTYPVCIHPPLQAGDGNHAVASSSARATDVGEMASLLPRYEAPPEYDEVWK